jgi:hypothetical protein
MPRRQSIRSEPSNVVPIRTKDRKPDAAPDAIESAAVLIGTGLGKAIKTTRKLRERLSAVGETIAETGKRAGKTLKESLPEIPGIGGKKKAPAAKKRVKKTARPAPAHGEDALTHQAAPATKRSTKATPPVTARRRASSPGRRG